MADPPAVIALLRYVHILTATLWLGGGVFFLFVIRPTVLSVPAVGGPFMRQVALQGRLPAFMAMMSGITTLFGFLLFWRVKAQDTYPMETVGGLLFTIGAGAGFIAFLLGLVFQMPTAKKMKAAAQDMGEGKPNPEAQARLQALARKMVRDGYVAVGLLAIALLGMVTAGPFLGTSL